MELTFQLVQAPPLPPTPISQHLAAGPLGGGQPGAGEGLGQDGK